ncbi:carbohydrate ABC transporter permease [Carboxydochorda subterranea]|uniref:Carbohydrate ABC transporter permease n=1 Tax=Carboxydichorda subterranea TaxID=3109565 RepID=A0ABZ1C2C5_9FIRM|nr:carbohydrate ABC transporter permease [Limnochorda sp. L945t]WRP18945.1 carbohydrate ABC transporter permease [Limnochorda sp. L945t]
MPALWLLSVSVRPAYALFEPSLIPPAIDLSAYGKVLRSSAFRAGVLNSLLVASCVTVIAVIAGLLAAYGLSRFRSRATRALLGGMLAPKMFPPILLAISYFAVFTSLGLYDTPWAVVLANVSGILPFTVWTLFNYLDTIPRELDEAAFVDGASKFRTLVSVVAPSALPGLVAISVYAFVLAWNEFLFGYLFLVTPARQVTTVYIAGFIGQFQTDYRMMIASTVLFSMPLVVIFLSVQRGLVKGLTAGAVKQ